MAELSVKKFNVTIRVILTKTIKVEAKNKEEAYELAHERFTPDYNDDVNEYELETIGISEACASSVGNEECRHENWEADLSSILGYAKAGNYAECCGFTDLWNNVLNMHAEAYPFPQSFDEYDTAWFERNKDAFVAFLEGVIEAESPTEILLRTSDGAAAHAAAQSCDPDSLMRRR